MAKNIDHQRFIELLTARFPEIAGGISDSSAGLLHPEMGHFAHATNDAIRKDDLVAVRAHFAFADEILNEATPEVENAIAVSYLENLRFKKDADGQIVARNLLSPKLFQILVELEAFWGNIAIAENKE